MVAMQVHWLKGAHDWQDPDSLRLSPDRARGAVVRRALLARRLARVATDVGTDRVAKSDGRGWGLRPATDGYFHIATRTKVRLTFLNASVRSSGLGACVVRPYNCAARQDPAAGQPADDHFN